MSLAQRLQAYKIDIDVQAPSQSRHASCRIAISRYLCQPLSTQPRSLVHDDDDKRVTFIQHDGDNWVFSAWDYAPGPGEDDFVCSFADMEAAIAAVLQYELGGPTLLDSWLVPLHRHPELSLEQVRFALANAITVNREAFEGIAERRRQRIFGNQMFGKDRWTWALQSQFLAIAHRSDPARLLRLRRDAQECYIVADNTVADR